MPQIKYYIFAFLVFLITHNYAQNNNEQAATASKDSITKNLNTSEILTINDNFYHAIIILKEAKVIADTNNDTKNQGLILYKIAKLQYQLNQSDSAKVNIKNAINIQSRIEDKINLAMSRYISGLIYLKEKSYTEALDYFKSSKSILEEGDHHELVAEIALKEATCNIELNDLNSANAFITQAANIGEKYKLPNIESASFIKKGIVSSKNQRYKKALFQIKEGLKISKRLNNLELSKDSYIALSKVYKEIGNYKLSNKNLWLHIAIKDSILALKNERLSPERNVQLAISGKDEELQQLKDVISDKEQGESLDQLTTILSVALITILSLLTLSLYKNNNIRIKTNNMLYKKNDELLTEKERAEIAAKTKSKFLSTVTHELRTPLYAVTGLTNMLLDENPKAEQIQHLKSLKFSGDYLLTFINDILQINKIEANKVDLDPEIFNLKHKVENVISALNNSASDNNTMMHFQYDKNLPETFDGDQLKISQILINLIGNSIKFTKDGNIWVKVNQLRQNKKTHTICIEVEDNGIGITKEKQKHMFESFSQGSIQINRKYGGTGLGLSIVKGLIDILKGKIYLKSELGKGSSFFIEVPLEEAKEVIAPVKIDYVKNINNLNLDEVTILVVEDNKINQMITKKILTKMNIKCELVDNGEDAVERVKSKDYDVVLMDIHMPGISGLEATKRIRSFNKELTIFALTAVTLEDKMQEFDEAGFNDIISKPFKQEDFEKILFEALDSQNKPA